MDEQQQQRVNEAAQQFVEALTGSYRTVSERSVSTQQLNSQLMQDFLTAVISNLRAQTEETHGASRELTEQARRGQEAGQVLARESVGVYMDFLNSMFPITGAAERGTPE